MQLTQLTEDEQEMFKLFWKGIMPEFKETKSENIRFFDGEWVYVRGYGGIHFIPADTNAWNIAINAGFDCCAEQDDMPYRTGRVIPKEIELDEVPDELDLLLGSERQKYL